jgi:hypothetical protein
MLGILGPRFSQKPQIVTVAFGVQVQAEEKEGGGIANSERCKKEITPTKIESPSGRVAEVS